MIAIDDHPLLDLGLFETRYPGPIGGLVSPAEVLGLLAADAAAPLHTGDEVRRAVRDLLRHGGFKPTGRSKPASEYLGRAAEEGRLGGINVAVDAGNAVSLHSGLPISVVDLDLAQPPLRIGIAAVGARYVFNPGGQEIDVGGLLCLLDAAGPCANAVKDAQRTKTHAGTTRTLSIVWGTKALDGRTGATVDWYMELVTRTGGEVLRTA